MDLGKREREVRVSETRQRTQNLVIRVTPAEADAIAAKALAADLTLSGFARAAMLDRKVVAIPEALLKSASDMGRLGGLLKKAFAYIDAGTLPSELRPSIDSILAEVRQAATVLRDQITHVR